MNDYPILEFDNAPEAVIEPGRVHKPVAGLPEWCVVCFFQEVISSVCANARVIAHLGSEIGKNPIYVLNVDGRDLTVVHPGVGAPLAAGFLEEIIAWLPQIHRLRRRGRAGRQNWCRPCRRAIVGRAG